eukprot:TRINITY_DN31709_c0_g1_i1.p1 TRINITY_DN31709_c0_g1~~TRINITY_DN31709_c0_g1_i1.p1  ORF type:complete len:1612 (-),score=604.92 TRINITY_DN31709_c0_g1_i1:295-5130(-)
MAEEDDGPPQGVIVCVRLRPLFKVRPDGTPGREAECTQIVAMEGKNDKGCGSAVTKIYDPNDLSAKPKEYAFDRSWWSSDGFMEDPERPGVNIPDGPNSKYVSQDMVWEDVGKKIIKNALRGYNVTVFAYGQSGAGKSYSVVGYPPNIGIIPRTVSAIYEVVDNNKEDNIRYQVEIAMLEVYMDEVYDLLEPRKKERQKLKVFVNKGEVFIYDPNDRKNMDKIWRAAKDHAQAESFRNLGDANRSVRATGMNPTSSRGHTLFCLRFRKEEQIGGAWVEKMRSKLSLVDLAGSERAHDTGLTGIGLEEGIAINQSLSALGSVLTSMCKGERVNYRDKLTQLLAESLGGNAVTVMIAALSPADINYNDTLSTLRFADNAKKMPVKVIKQLDPTAQLIADLKTENEKLQKQLEALGGGGENAVKEKEEYEKNLAAAEGKLADMEAAYKAMEAKVQKGGRLRLACLAFKIEDKTKIQLLDAEIAQLREEIERLGNSNSQEDAAGKQAELERKLAEKAALEANAQTAADEAAKGAKAELEQKAKEMEEAKAGHDAKVKELQEQIADMQAQMQALASAGADNNDEKKKLEELQKQEEEEERAAKQALAEEKAAVEALLDTRLADIEQMMHEKDEAKQTAEQQKQPAAKAARMEEVTRLEEAIRVAKEELAGMEPRANDCGVGGQLRAALLNLEKQDSEAKAKALHVEVERLRAEDKGQDELLETMRKEQEAIAEAKQTAEAARQAAEIALEEKLAELQKLSRERDEAQAQAMEAKQRLEPMEAELREKKDAIESIIEREQATWESKLQASAKAEQMLKKSFEDMGLSVSEIMAVYRGASDESLQEGDVLPHLVNLCEDAHDDGLVYLIPEGITKVKRLDDDDTEAAIKLDGKSIREHHCTFTYDAESGEVSVSLADESAILWVDGDMVKKEAKVILEHADRVIMGSDFCFRYVDPRAKKKRTRTSSNVDASVVIDYKYAMEELARKNGFDADAQIEQMRDRMQEAMAKREAELAEEQKLLEERLEQERAQYEEDIKKLQARADGKVADILRAREQAQERTELALGRLQGRITASKSRAQWVRAAFRTKKDERFELDVRLARSQMSEMQPRIVEANRISTLHNRNVTYSFHMLDAVDPRAREGNNRGELQLATAAGMMALVGGVAGGLAGGALGTFAAGPVGCVGGMAGGAQAGMLAGGAAATAGVAAVAGIAVAMHDGESKEDEALLPKRLLLQVKVEHKVSKETQLWSQQKFMERFIRMLSFANGESLDTFFDEEDARYEDIFWDQQDHSLIGTAAIGLTPLLSQQAVRESVTLRSVTGEVKGALSLTMSLRTKDSGMLLSSAMPVVKWSRTKTDTLSMRNALKDKEVRGEVKFGRLTNVGDTWAGLFVRFSWFDTHGRMELESPVVETANIGHTFTFEAKCSEAFLEYLERGVMALQVRAYEKCKVKDFELRDLRLKLRKAEAELSKYRGGVLSKTAGGAGGAGMGAIICGGAGAVVAGPIGAAAGVVVGGMAGGALQHTGKTGSLEEDLAQAREESHQAKGEVEELKRELELARRQGAQKPASSSAAAAEEARGSSETENKQLRQRVQELEGQIDKMQAAAANNQNKSQACTVM